MRILHVNHDFLPRHRAGSEVYLDHLCRAQTARSHQVHVFCADYLPSERHGRLRWREYEGIPVTEVINNWLFTSFEESWDDPQINRLFGHVLAAVEPDVVHIHNILNLSVSIPEIVVAHGIPCVATLHDFSWLCPSGGQLTHHPDGKTCTEIDPRRCHQCFSASPYAAQIAVAPMLRFGILRAPIESLVNGLKRFAPRMIGGVTALLSKLAATSSRAPAWSARIDEIQRALTLVGPIVAPSGALADRFRSLLGSEVIATTGDLVVSEYGMPKVEAERIPRSPREPLRIGFIGTIVPAKGADLLIAAAARLESKEFEVRVYGSSSVDPTFVSGLEDRAVGLPIRFMGPFDAAALAEVFASIDVLVVPSRWPENSPLVVHEAFSFGVPVIASRVGGMVELIDDRRSGLLFESESVSDLVAKLAAVIDDRDLLTRLSAGTQQPKSIDTDCGEWEQRYRQVMASCEGRERPRSPRARGPETSQVSPTCALLINYGTPAAIRLSVRSLRSSQAEVADVLVVDLSTTADQGSPPQQLLEAADGAEIDTIENRGFAGAVNHGLARLFRQGARRVLVLDADVMVTSGCVGALERSFEMFPECGVSGPRLLRSRDPQTIAGCGITFSKWTGRTVHPGSGRRHSADIGSTASVRAIDGGAMMIRREVFDAIGPLDESYFFGFEDLDYCSRARRAGFSVLCVNQAIAYHYEGLSLDRRSPDRIYYATRNHLAYANQVEPVPTPLRQLRGISIACLNTAYALRWGRPRLRCLAAVVRGVSDCWRGRMGKR